MLANMRRGQSHAVLACPSISLLTLLYLLFIMPLLYRLVHSGLEYSCGPNSFPLSLRPRDDPR
jgi:hypothetical protein